MGNNEWKLPLNLAIGLHVLLVLAAIYLPDLFLSRPILPQVFTINLVNVATPEPKSAPAAQPKRETQHERIRPEVKIKDVEIKKPVPAVQREEKAVSLNPLKRRLKEEAENALLNEKLKKLEMIAKREQANEEKKRLERIRKKEIAESVRAEQVAAREARIAADELKQMLQTSTSVKTARDTEGKGNSQGQQSSNNVSLVENQYYALVANRIQSFWSVTEQKTWDPSLLAIYDITINQDGTIASQSFEKRSGDKFFDQFVEKAIRDATPLPQIPPALKRSQIQFAVRFKPSGIQ